MDGVKQAISESRCPLVAGHVNPDADCIASILVLHGALRSLGKPAKMILPRETVGRRFAFMLDLLPGGEAVDGQDAFDLVVVADTALRKRINLSNGFELPAKAPVCNIDHHLGNERYGQVNWVDSTSASTTQMVFALLESLGVPVGQNAATLLYAGLHGDTGGFSLQGTSGSALQVAAKLADCGADIPHVCQRLYRCLSLSEFRLMRLAYDNTRVNPTGRVAWSTITHAELAEAGCGPDDIDEQVTVPRSIAGVRIAILFSESRPRRVRMNMRSEDGLNILPLAKSLGGGGHAQAAGLVHEGHLPEIVKTVIAKAEQYLAQTEGNGVCQNNV